MARLPELQYGENFVGRDFEIQELKEKIERNGVVILTGDRGIGKTNLMHVVMEDLKNEGMKCEFANGSFFIEDMKTIFKPSKLSRISGISVSIVGISRDTPEHFILELMEKSKEKTVFIENAHELDKKESELILEATKRNNKLRFIIEIATPYMPDFGMRISTHQLVELDKLNNDAIKKIIIKECPGLSDTVVNKIISLSIGYPYVAMQLAYICDEKNTPDDMLGFLGTLKRDDLENNLDTIHNAVLETLQNEGQEVIKKIALAPSVLTLGLIGAFCGEEIDAEFTDIEKRGILRHKNERYEIYHPLFREYLRHEQPYGMGKERITKTYEDAMVKVKSELDSIGILLEVLKEPDLFKAGIFEDLIKTAENCEVLNSIGSQCYTWGKMDYAILSWSRILKISGTREWESIAIGNMGIVFRIQGDLEKALEYYGKALKIDGEIGDRQGMAIQLGNMGLVFRIQGDLEKALEYYGKALKIDEEIGYRQGMAIQLGNMGNVFRIQGDLEKALEHHGKALEIFEEIGDRQGMANLLGNMGIVFGIEGDLEKALEHFEKALEVLEEIGDRQGMANLLGNMGNVFQIQGDLKKTLEHFEKALEIFEEIGDRQGMANLLGNMGLVFYDQGDLKKALEHFEKALEIFEEIGDRQGMANQLGNMGLVFYDQGDLEKALECLEQALEIFKSIGANREVVQTMSIIESLKKKG